MSREARNSPTATSSPAAALLGYGTCTVQNVLPLVAADFSLTHDGVHNVQNYIRVRGLAKLKPRPVIATVYGGFSIPAAPHAQTSMFPRNEDRFALKAHFRKPSATRRFRGYHPTPSIPRTTDGSGAPLNNNHRREIQSMNRSRRRLDPVGVRVQNLPILDQALVVAQLAQSRSEAASFAPRDIDALFDAIGLPQPGRVSNLLRSLQRKGLVRSRQTRGAWCLTPHGIRRVQDLVSTMDLATLEVESAMSTGPTIGRTAHPLIPAHLAPPSLLVGLRHFLAEYPFDKNVFGMTRFLALVPATRILSDRPWNALVMFALITA